MALGRLDDFRLFMTHPTVKNRVYLARLSPSMVGKLLKDRELKIGSEGKTFFSTLISVKKVALNDKYKELLFTVNDKELILPFSDSQWKELLEMFDWYTKHHREL